MVEIHDDRVVSAALLSLRFSGRSEPAPGRELHPLKSRAFSRRTFSPTRNLVLNFGVADKKVWMYADKVNIALVKIRLRNQTSHEANDETILFRDKAGRQKMNEKQLGKHLCHPSSTPPLVNASDDHLRTEPWPVAIEDFYRN